MLVIHEFSTRSQEHGGQNDTADSAVWGEAAPAVTEQQSLGVVGLIERLRTMMMSPLMTLLSVALLASTRTDC